MTSGALVIGEALIDEVVEGDRVARHPGGSPANVALGLARLDVPTRLHTALGADEDGELIRRHLVASGVSITAASSTDGPTSKAVATLAEDGSATYDFALSWEPRELDELGEPRVIHTGSLGAFLEPGAEVTSEILSRGRGGGALITFDPNVRPSLIQGAEAARARFTDLAARSHLTKLSEEDAEYLFPAEPLDRVLDRILEAGVAVAAITRGGDGALLASGQHRISIPPVKTTVADTVGAGDSFMATLIWALVFGSEGWDGQPISAARLEEIGSKAALAASITVSRHGADLPRASDLTTTQPVV